VRVSVAAADLRRQLQDEQLDEFRTQKTVLQQDVVEALLGRLTSPSVRLASQLGGDPQVLAALNLAKDVERYQQVLEPDGEDLLGTQPKTSDGRTSMRQLDEGRTRALAVPYALLIARGSCAPPEQLCDATRSCPRRSLRWRKRSRRRRRSSLWEMLELRDPASSRQRSSPSFERPFRLPLDGVHLLQATRGAGACTA
jgi:hypothetical protein